MRRRGTGRTGRPSKGPRHLFQLSLLPAEQTDAILLGAHQRGLSLSEYLAVVIARAHHVDEPWPARTGSLLDAPRTHLDQARLVTRVPQEAADRVMDEAESRDMSYTQYVAAIVCQAHGFDFPLQVRVEPQAEELRIGA